MHSPPLCEGGRGRDFGESFGENVGENTGCLAGNLLGRNHEMTLAEVAAVIGTLGAGGRNGQRQTGQGRQTAPCGSAKGRSLGDHAVNAPRSERTDAEPRDRLVHGQGPPGLPRLPLPRRVEQAPEQPPHRDGSAARQPDARGLLGRAHLRRPSEAGDRRRRDRRHALSGQPAHLPTAALRRAGADRRRPGPRDGASDRLGASGEQRLRPRRGSDPARRLRAQTRPGALPQRHRHRRDRAEARLGGSGRRRAPAHHQPGGDLQQGLLQHGATGLCGQRFARTALRHHRHAGEVSSSSGKSGASRTRSIRMSPTREGSMPPPVSCWTVRWRRCARSRACWT